MFITCLTCKEEKHQDNFSKSNQYKNGKKAYCKSCEAIRYNEWRGKNLLKIRKRDRIKYYVRKYNFDLEQAEAFVDNRNGICEICSEATVLVVDHNHDTNEVRGFICSSCNSALGYVKEKISVCEALIEYIRKYNA